MTYPNPKPRQGEWTMQGPVLFPSSLTEPRLSVPTPPIPFLSLPRVPKQTLRKIQVFVCARGGNHVHLCRDGGKKQGRTSEGASELAMQRDQGVRVFSKGGMADSGEPGSA